MTEPLVPRVHLVKIPASFHSEERVDLSLDEVRRYWRTLSPDACKVLVMGRFIDADVVQWPLLVRACSMTKLSVQRALAELKAARLIETVEEAK